MPPSAVDATTSASREPGQIAAPRKCAVVAIPQPGRQTFPTVRRLRTKATLMPFSASRGIWATRLGIIVALPSNRMSRLTDQCQRLSPSLIGESRNVQSARTLGASRFQSWWGMADEPSAIAARPAAIDGSCREKSGARRLDAIENGFSRPGQRASLLPVIGRRFRDRRPVAARVAQGDRAEIAP